MADCLHGWSLDDSSCYYVQTNLTLKLAFWGALNWCKGWNGSLTSVLSKNENEFLDQLINKTNLRPNETFYIGLRRRRNSSEIRWVDRQPYNYTNWYDNQGTGLNGESENLTTKRCTYYNHVHQWEMELCKIKRLFICKRPKNEEGMYKIQNNVLQ